MYASLILGLPFFVENTITDLICPDMLEEFCFPQLDGIDNPDIMCPSRFNNVVRDALNDKFPDRLGEVNRPLASA
jgi:hypothetical protein